MFIGKDESGWIWASNSMFQQEILALRVLVSADSFLTMLFCREYSIYRPAFASHFAFYLEKHEYLSCFMEQAVQFAVIMWVSFFYRFNLLKWNLCIFKYNCLFSVHDFQICSVFLEHADGLICRFIHQMCRLNHKHYLKSNLLVLLFHCLITKGLLISYLRDFCLYTSL